MLELGPQENKKKPTTYSSSRHVVLFLDPNIDMLHKFCLTSRKNISEIELQQGMLEV